MSSYIVTRTSYVTGWDNHVAVVVSAASAYASADADDDDDDDDGDDAFTEIVRG